MTATTAVTDHTGRHQRVSARMRRVAAVRAGLLTLYGWAVAEALMRPLIPTPP